MGWKPRGGRNYFYRSERDGGQVRTHYVGTGELAESIAQLQQIEAQTREARRYVEKDWRERDERLSDRIQRACRLLNIAAEALVEASGYHRHHRGPWRRRRTMSTETAVATIAEADPIADLAGRYKAGDSDASKEVDRIIAKANKGDEDAAGRFRELIKAAPEVASCFRSNLARVAENQMLRRAFGKDSLASIVAIQRKIAAIRADLEGPTPSPVERLLAERAALCWLDCYHNEIREADPSNRTIPQADFQARQRDRAHRRYLSALKALAAVRKLPIVAVQVNMGADALPGGRG